MMRRPASGQLMRLMMKLSLALALMLALVSLLPAQQPTPPASALSSLVEAERAFARASVERGVRDAFIAFFADDGINFQPHPTKTKEAFLSRPAPATRPPVTLDWQPVFADVSLAGDLGYTTGPYTLTDHSAERRPTRHGYYFSIWKRQADGTWKVALDLGITTPAAESPAPAFHAATPVKLKPSKLPPDAEAERASLLRLESEFAREAKRRGTRRAYMRYLSEESRLHRSELFPLVGREAIGQYLSGKNFSLRWQPIQADIARSADLGYTYGSYELTNAGQPAGRPMAVAEKGYYVHVWKREPSGQWRLVFETTHPLPPEQK